jgi:hypothetical protein
MTEEQLLQAVRDLARLRGWLTYHTHRSDRPEPGFPDLVLLHPRTGQLVFAELKTDRGLLSKPQETWLAALRLARSHKVNVHVWRPADLTRGVITRVLTPAATMAEAH